MAVAVRGGTSAGGFSSGASEEAASTAVRIGDASVKAAVVGAGAAGAEVAGAAGLEAAAAAAEADEGGAAGAAAPAFPTTGGCALAAVAAGAAGVCGGPPGRMALQKDDVSVLGRRTGIGGGGCLLGSPGFTKLSIISSWRWNSYK